MSRKPTASRQRTSVWILGLFFFGFIGICRAESPDAEAVRVFQQQVGDLFARKCLQCHNEVDRKGGLSLSTADDAMKGGESGVAIVAKDTSSSMLLEMISGDPPAMPEKGRPLSEAEITNVRQWIAGGASWPQGHRLTEPQVTDMDWWSLKPLVKPAIPSPAAEDASLILTPIDAFILAELRRHQMQFSPEADRRTLIRRVYFDLIGLPPDEEDVSAFVHDNRSEAYDELVDRLLNSPQYGERWARHWLDVVHYGDTHGYDKDKPRPNAWPYRDYVIRSFNKDKPYSQFVLEQIAGDVLWPENAEAIEATGFIAAGPWDFIGHAEVPETKYDGQVARNLDRDDMVSSTMNTFLSITVQCARCHNHKFDPITQEHYYSLQSVFAALDRADRLYDRDPQVAETRQILVQTQDSLNQKRDALLSRIQKLGGEPLAHLEKQISEVEQRLKSSDRPEYGYHSEISASQDVSKWVQIDLGREQPIDSVSLIGASDDFAGIGKGFGFPVRFRVEASNSEDFRTAVVTLVDKTQEDFANPGTTPVVIAAKGTQARFLRVTATKLAPRQNDFIFALAELKAIGSQDENLAKSAAVASLDSIEAPSRWQRINLTDEIYPGSNSKEDAQQLSELQKQRDELLQERVSESIFVEQKDVEAALQEIADRLSVLPQQQVVYAGTVHRGSGAFQGTGASGGKPREIRILYRGELRNPGPLVEPGTLPLIQGVESKFALPPEHTEGQRRVALAKWLVRPDNGLLWRSIVNRVWLYHFGRGIVDSPNDFGRMGEQPTHPDLLDWMAVEFRDGKQSIKELHRLIVTSHTYRQSSTNNPEFAKQDGENRFLWRMNRQLLTAEAIRDSVLAVSGQLDRTMYGPAFMDFVVERPEHSPHYEYHKYNPDDVTTHRRSVYRFLVRSQQQPFMQSLGCADPSQSVAKRDSSLTSLQALTLLNNAFMVRMSENFAKRIMESSSEPAAQMDLAFRLALSRPPTNDESIAMQSFVQKHGLANACRVLFNLNEFVFID